MIDALQKLMEKLQYTFQNMTWLSIALNHHPSNAIHHHQRMEFLGDALLGFVISDLLYRHVQAPEGELSRIRSHWVRRESLASMAQFFHLDQYMMLPSSGEHGRLLADAMESVIAAIYLDSNIETCYHWIEHHCYPVMHQKLKLRNEKDFKTQLQEIAQARRWSLPVYTLIGERLSKKGQLEFEIQCHIPGKSLVTQSKSYQKKHAEQLCAKDYLESLRRASKQTIQ